MQKTPTQETQSKPHLPLSSQLFINNNKSVRLGFIYSFGLKKKQYIYLYSIGYVLRDLSQNRL